jgi:hypothetical protein
VEAGRTAQGSRQPLITVEAPDRVGLLWAVASWFADHRLNIEAAQLEQQGERTVDRFSIDGSPDVNGLASHLGGTRRRFRWVPKPGRAYHQRRAADGP